jgi:hypothetical protein
VHRRDGDGIAEAELVEIRHVLFASVGIDLVRDEERPVAEPADDVRDRSVLRGQAVGDVDHEHDDVGLGRRRLRHVGDLARELAFGRQLEAAGVDDVERTSSPFRRVQDLVARDAGALLDDRLAASDDAVHERRLPDVRTPDDRDHRRRHDAG